MPLYEYFCEECGARFERLRRMAEADDPIECPDCESGKTTRQISAPVCNTGSGGGGRGGCGSGGGGRFS
jgi:putative FmdB family regulatory protein